MQNFMPEDFSREHRQMLKEQADHARLVNLVRAGKRNARRQHSLNLQSVWRMLSYANEWLRSRSQVSTESKPVTAGR